MFTHVNNALKPEKQKMLTCKYVQFGVDMQLNTKYTQPLIHHQSWSKYETVIRTEDPAGPKIYTFV